MLRETEQPMIRTSYANVLAFFALRQELIFPPHLYFSTFLSTEGEGTQPCSLVREIFPLDFSKGEQVEAFSPSRSTS